jgi:hypothetical protein
VGLCEALQADIKAVNDRGWVCPLGAGLPHWGLQLVTGTADFIRNFPPMSAAGTRQHPQQGPLLSSSGGGGDGGRDGSGALVRPTTGLLWPRGV